MIMCPHVQRVSPMPAIAANCESPSESDEHLAGGRDSEAEACEGHEDVRVSEVRQTDDSDKVSEVRHVGQDVSETDGKLSEIDDNEISEADMMSDESHETYE